MCVGHAWPMDTDPIVIEQLPGTRHSLRVAVVTETYPPEINGVALTVARFIEGLRRRNHDIQLLRPRQDTHEEPGSIDNFSEVLLRGLPVPSYPGLRMGLPAKRTLQRIWTVQRPDLVHIVTEGPLGWSALQAAGKLRLPVCSDFRTNFHAYSRHYGIGWLKRPIASYLRKFHNRTLATMVPTEEIRNQLLALGFHNLRVVARGVDTSQFNPRARSQELRSAWGARPEDPVAIHVGRLAPEKNIDLVILGAREMQLRQPRLRLVFVGDGPDREALRARCPEAIFCGLRTGTDLAAHYASADIFLFPSVTETFGNVTLEAMASGLAIVAFDYAAARAHLDHGISGMLAPCWEHGTFAHMAADLATNADLMRSLGIRARAAAERLDWDHVVTDLEHIFEWVAARRQTSHHAYNCLARPALLR